MTPDEALAAAWTYCAPSREKSTPYPRGFWPDVARVAIAMVTQNTTTPNLDFTPTRCSNAGLNKPRSARRGTAKTRAENTAALLAELGL